MAVHESVLGRTYWQSSGSGEYAAAERHQLHIPKNWHFDQSQRGVVFCHGLGGDWQPSFLPLALADAGFVVITADMGGTAHWCSTAAIDRVADAWTLMKARANVKTDKKLLAGNSMGAGQALIHAMLNASTTAAVVGTIPLVDMEDVRANNRGGYQAAIEAVHGSPVPSNKRPNQNVASFTMPVRLDYHTDDPICDAGVVTAFDTAVATCTAVSMGTGGHDFTATPTDQWASFLSQYVA